MSYIHKSAEIAKKVTIGRNTIIWSYVQIRENVIIGDNCIIGKGVYIDHGIVIGNNVKIQNYACIYNETIIHDGVFIGPHVCITNDKYPRAINRDGTVKKASDWKKGKTVLHKGVAIGAGSILLPDIEINQFALIGAGSVVTKSVKAYKLAVGNPAKVLGNVCACGNVLGKVRPNQGKCTRCKQ